MDQSIKELAHDINNKMMALALVIKKIDKSLEESTGQVGELIEKAQQIVSDVTDYCKSVIIPTELNPLSLKDEISNELKTLSDSNIEFEFFHSPLVLINKTEFQRLINNLVKNSSEASATSMKFVLRKKSLIYLDNGRGMNDEILQSLKVHKSISTKGEGHGHGMSQIFNFCKSHDWNVILENHKTFDKKFKSGFRLIFTFKPYDSETDSSKD